MLVLALGSHVYAHGRTEGLQASIRQMVSG